MGGWITELNEYIIKTDKNKLSAKEISDHFGLPLQVLCQQVLYIFHRSVKEHVLCLKGEREPSCPFLYTPMEKWMYQKHIPKTGDRTTIIPRESYDGRLTEFTGGFVYGYKIPYSMLLSMGPEDYPGVFPKTWTGGSCRDDKYAYVAPFSIFRTVNPSLSQPVISTYKEIGAIGGWVDPDEETGEMSYFFGHALYLPGNQKEIQGELSELTYLDGLYDIFKYDSVTEMDKFIHEHPNVGYTGPTVRRSGCYWMQAGEDSVLYDYDRPCFEASYGDGKVCLLVPVKLY